MDHITLFIKIDECLPFSFSLYILGILFDGFNGIAAIDHDMHFEPQKKQKTDK